MSNDDDVPSPIDFCDPAQAHAWMVETVRKRPYRPAFFAAFAAALTRERPVTILELGSGPGHLARAILERCAVATYVALDFSEAMHALARAHLGELAERVTFVTRDFREPSWAAGLGPVDAIVTLQAAHETRHKRHLAPLLERARAALGPGGVLLYADHYCTATTKHPALAPTPAEQVAALRIAGYPAIELLLDEGGMALYAAR